MKQSIILLLLASVIQTNAQWRDTTNFFEDTLHTPVGVVNGSQRHPLVLTSYPDGGFIVVWEDERNVNNTDIYAQKYDQNGNRLWAENGVPVAANPTREHYTFSSNQDYRNRHFIATDSAGGFYLSFSEDSISSYTWEKVTVQHVRNNGTRVFPGSGIVFARSTTANLQMMPQLVPDGNRGFYLAYKYKQGNLGNEYVAAYCFRDENGTLKYYGGGLMNENGVQRSAVAPCGTRTWVEYPGTSLLDFGMWPDGDGGCNFLMVINGNTSGQHTMLAYNKLWRCKKNATVRTYFRNTSGAACPRFTQYQRGDVYPLYQLRTDYQSIACGGGSGPLYTYTNYRLLSNGYDLVDIQGYDYYYPKGATITTTGNINVDVMAVTRRTYANNVVSDFIIYGYGYAAEKFDSIPYQRTSFNNPDIGYNTQRPDGMDVLDFFRDTLLAFSNYYQDFSVAGGANHFYATGVMAKTGNRQVLLQHLTARPVSPGRFALSYDNSVAGFPYKYGRAIGSELSQGNNGAIINYDVPHVTATAKGQAFFSILESGWSPRISPITNGSELIWGAMGRTTGTGVFNSNYTAPANPVFAVDSNGRTGLIVWSDTRHLPDASNENVYMRQVNHLNEANYTPPLKPVKNVYYYATDVAANPAVLYGTSRQYTPVEIYNSYNAVGFSPVVSIHDVHYMGHVKVHVLQHFSAIRRYNNIPYLNRNITIKTDSLVPGANYDLLLYFTKAEFDALKAADVTIGSPGDLVVIRQPGTNITAPSAYTPVAGEEVMSPVFWDSVAGGYRLKITAKGMGNFFVQKMPTTSLCTATSTSFTSNVSGTSYRWQVSNGGAYTDINNGVNYSGAATATLQVINPPSSFNGNRYRCVVNSTLVSNSFYLQIANTFTGAVNNAWENAGNWSCNRLPDANTDVIINSGSVTVNSNAACHSLQVAPGATVNVATGFSLTVTN